MRRMGEGSRSMLSARWRGLTSNMSTNVSRLSSGPVSGLVATRRRRWLSAGAVAMPVVLVVVACGTGVGAEQVTAKVARGTVERTVAATGTLQAISEQNLGFAKSGKLVELLVTVGQTV